MISQIKPKVIIFVIGIFFVAHSAVFAQTPSETPPPPSEPPTVKIPLVNEMTLPNGLKVVVIQKKNLPLVTASLLIKGGADVESPNEAGLADMTGALLIKGTEGLTASQIAEQIEFLGASINSGAGWNASSVTINTMRQSLGKALSIMANSAIRPSFPEDEVKLLKKQTLDGFDVSLKQPGSLLSYVSSQYTFAEHLTGGTPQTIKRLTRKDIVGFHQEYYRPENSVLIFTGDVNQDVAFRFAKLFFGGWQSAGDFGSATIKAREAAMNAARSAKIAAQSRDDNSTVRRLLVIDLPDSGQAAVGYAKQLSHGRAECEAGADGCISGDIYYAATVLNSVLGGGYSSRLNQEIRLKRGLSYGAGSGFGWRGSYADFSASAQTKNESAAEVAELMKMEIERLVNDDVSKEELVPRKAAVTGGFGLGLQTNGGLAGRLRDLYLYGISSDELNSYMNAVNSISGEEIKQFAKENLTGGDIIIVGDAKVFMSDLQKRFPNQTIEVIKADALDLNTESLRSNPKIKLLQ
ncbi:MAG: pitrilysin family protein [Pyrinomonadaceae bacterium]